MIAGARSVGSRSGVAVSRQCRAFNLAKRLDEPVATAKSPMWEDHTGRAPLLNRSLSMRRPLHAGTELG